MSERTHFLEIAAFTPSSALVAIAAGCDRLELCSSRSVGGLTPSLSDFEVVKKAVDESGKDIPIFVMLRPEHDERFVNAGWDGREEVEGFKGAGAGGFVCGVLDDEGRVDEERCRALIQAAHPLPCTFHRAFDLFTPLSPEHLQALETIISLGFTSVLTSGGPSSQSIATRMYVLMNLSMRAMGRIEIITGGGVRTRDFMLEDLMSGGSKWFHSSAITDEESGEADIEEVKALRRVLDDWGKKPVKKSRSRGARS